MKKSVDRKTIATAPFVMLTQAILTGEHWSQADAATLIQCAEALDDDSDSKEIRALTKAFRAMAKFCQ